MTDHMVFSFEQLRTDALARATNIAVQQQIKPIVDTLQARNRAIRDGVDGCDLLIETLNIDYNNVNDAGKHRRGAAYGEALGVILDALEETRRQSQTSKADSNAFFEPIHGLTRNGEIPRSENTDFEPDEYYTFKRATHSADNYGIENARMNLLGYAAAKYAEGQAYGTPVTMATSQGDITVRVDVKARRRLLSVLGSSEKALNAYVKDLRIEHAEVTPQAAARLR